MKFTKDTDTIELWAMRGGVYFPIRTWKLSALREAGFGNQFAFGYSGQIPQFSVEPSGCFTSTPHVDSPVHDLKLDTAGIPARGKVTDTMNVTVFFATGQTNVLLESDIVVAESASEITY